MKSITVRKRHRLRRKEIAKLESELEETFGMKIELGIETDRAHTNMGYDIIFSGGMVIAFMAGGGIFLTIEGLLRYRPDRRWVTVDMGAVRFVHNGADVMAPGIVDASPDVQTDMLVWIRDEKNAQPLAVGRALMSGMDMGIEKKGKAVESIHFIGDALWELGRNLGISK